MEKKTLTVVAKDSWEKVAPGHLHATIEIEGLMCHVEAHEVMDYDQEVVRPGDFCQDFAHGSADYEKLFDAFGAEKAWQTATIKGKQYAIFVSPFCV